MAPISIVGTRNHSSVWNPGKASIRPYSSLLDHLLNSQSPLAGVMPTARIVAQTTSSHGRWPQPTGRPPATRNRARLNVPRGLAHAPPNRHLPVCLNNGMRFFGLRCAPRAPDARREDGGPSHERRHPPYATRRVPGTHRNIGQRCRKPRECRGGDTGICCLLDIRSKRPARLPHGCAAGYEIS